MACCGHGDNVEFDVGVDGGSAGGWQTWTTKTSSVSNVTGGQGAALDELADALGRRFVRKSSRIAPQAQ